MRHPGHMSHISGDGSSPDDGHPLCGPGRGSARSLDTTGTHSKGHFKGMFLNEKADPWQSKKGYDKCRIRGFGSHEISPMRMLASITLNLIPCYC